MENPPLQSLQTLHAHNDQSTFLQMVTVGKTKEINCIQKNPQKNRKLDMLAFPLGVLKCGMLCWELSFIS